MRERKVCDKSLALTQTTVPGMKILELEDEIGKMARAMMTRNIDIGDALIAHLRTKLTDEEVAGLVLVSLERLVWLDTNLFLWTLQNFIPSDVAQEIRRITSVSVCKQLIARKFMPGTDFSVDGEGKLLLSNKAKQAILPSIKMG